MRQHIFSLAIFIFSVVSFSKTFAQISCGTRITEHDYRLPKNNSLFDKSENPQQQSITDNGAVYTLPVVVHVITTGDAIGSPDNPSDSLINAMINELNKCWRKNYAAAGGVDTKIQFALAVRSPQCGSTTGIERVDGSGVANYVSGGITNINTPGSADEIAVKNLSRWSNVDYINIWIVNKINGNPNVPGGYTYFPEHNSASIDGMVLNASVVNGTNKTVAHEMGHFFYLYHPFEDGGSETTCAANDDCANEGDKVCDTEPELNAPGGTSTNSCNSNWPFIIADAAKNYTVLNNYMGYTACQFMFTQGQKDRARAALISFRYGLITSKALTAPDGLTPVAACTPTATYGLSPYYGVEKVEFNTLSVYSNTSAGDGVIYVDRTCNQSTTVKQGKRYLLKITGSYGNPHRIKVFIDYNNNGSFGDANEMVLSMYTDTAAKKILIPATGVATNTALRMRVVADNPATPQPTSCKLHGTSDAGAGQAEDYTVIITPSAAKGIDEMNADKNVVEEYHADVYPNPAHDVENIVIYSKTEKNISLIMADQSGRKTGEKNLHCNTGANYLQWNVSELPKGVYFFSFTNVDLKAIKIVKE